MAIADDFPVLVRSSRPQLLMENWRCRLCCITLTTTTVYNFQRTIESIYSDSGKKTSCDLSMAVKVRSDRSVQDSKVRKLGDLKWADSQPCWSYSGG